MAVHRVSYHHGNLRTALLEAGLELTRTGGPGALVLRDVTRQVGVSPNAAYRHFADRRSLLAAVAERIQHDVVVAMRGAPAPTDDDLDPAARARRGLRAVGLGYIGFALREPGWFEVAFGSIDPVELGDDGGAADLPAPLARLVEALDALVAVGSLSPADRVGAEWPCWSAVHGFAVLALDGPLRGQPPEQVWTAARRTVDAVIAGLLRTTAGDLRSGA